MSRQNHIAQHFPRVLIKQIINHAEIAQGFGHLLPFDINKAIVQPVIGKGLAIMGAAALGNFIFMMGED